MEFSKFTHKDEAFYCENCGQNIEPLGYTSRDHCPHCLHSKHVDINPGDRLETCHGLLKPIGIRKTKKGMQIYYECQKCKKNRVNIIADDDNMDLIIKLSANPI